MSIHSAILDAINRGPIRGPSTDWGSSSHGHIGNGIDFSFEELSEGGAELAVEDGATDLEQEIGATSLLTQSIGEGCDKQLCAEEGS